MNTKPVGASLDHAKIQPHSNAIHNRLEDHPKSGDKKQLQTDQISLGNKNQENFGTYKVDAKKLAKIMQDFNKNTETFKLMVQNMIEKQGGKVNQVLEALANGEEVLIEVDAETRAQAQDAISENGYWGVEQTSARILEFAKTISGGDPSKIDTLVNAFKEGFEKAKEAFGGELPEISQQTYDKVMEGFEAWRDSSSTQ
jgi:hypothetical protein